MKCPKCQFENPEKAKYCIKCGKPMEFHYPECGAKTPVIGDFCMECGHPLKEAKETSLIDYTQGKTSSRRYVCASLAAGTRRVLVSQRDLGRERPSYR